ncbi:MAG: transcriptional repressor [Planctomycetaceae bacterium]|nr:transcriptional repressor [Planctomycetaceae bacterium]
MSELTALNVAATPIEKFQEFLVTRGMRMTRERNIIVEEVFASHEHFDAEQLVEQLSRRRDSRRVSRSTVFRTLRQLVEAGLLRSVARQDGREVYEHDYGYPQHDHLICRKCGTLIEFHNSQIRDILEEVARERGFRMEAHRLEVTGLCDNCCRPPASRPKKLNLL